MPLSVIVIAAERRLETRGVKVTLTVQKPLTAIVAGLIGQLLVCAKSPGLVPVTAMALMLNGLGPLLVTVIACEPLVVFTVWFPKPTEDGARVTFGGGNVPVPARLTD